MGCYYTALSITPRGVAVVCFHGNISVKAGIIWKQFDLCTEILVATMAIYADTIVG